MKLYEEKMMEKILRTVLIASSFYYVLKITKQEEIIKMYLGDKIMNVIYAIFILSGTMTVMDREYYLPFLGDTVIPTGLLPSESIPNGANMEVEMTITPNTKILYWASEPCENTLTCGKERMAWEAYGNLTNGGTATSDDKGYVRFLVRGKPQDYNVPYKKDVIKPHIHYREFKGNGMLGKIMTHYV